MTDVKNFLDTQWSSNKPLDYLIAQLAAPVGGVTIGVLVNRLRKFSKAEVAETIEAMEKAGKVVVTVVPSGRRQKATLVIQAV